MALARGRKNTHSISQRSKGVRFVTVNINGRRVVYPIKSSFIRDVGYDEDMREMTMKFKSGEKYRYYNVTPGEVTNLFRKGISTGSTFWKSIRTKKVYSREK